MCVLPQGDTGPKGTPGIPGNVSKGKGCWMEQNTILRHCNKPHWRTGRIGVNSNCENWHVCYPNNICVMHIYIFSFSDPCTTKQTKNVLEKCIAIWGCLLDNLSLSLCCVFLSGSQCYPWAWWACKYCRNQQDLTVSLQYSTFVQGDRVQIQISAQHWDRTHDPQSRSVCFKAVSLLDIIGSRSLVNGIEGISRHPRYQEKQWILKSIWCDLAG